MHKKPIWDISKSNWIAHKPNPRFAIFHPGPLRDKTKDVVFDKETGLIWERVSDSEKKTWEAAILYSYTKAVAGRKGWRLPSIEELLSLVDPTRSNPSLPDGHPFLNVQLDYFYWSSSLGMTNLPTYAWGYDFRNANTSNVLKSTECYVWLVRGESGHDYPY